MQSSLRKSTIVAAVACALALAVTPADAASAKSLTLSLHDEGQLLATAIVTMQCEPHLGTHPRLRQACSAVEKAAGDLEALETTGTACPMIFQPVTAAARGRWNGKPVRFHRTFANRCVAASETQDVFRF